jgi:hypothetical protein
VGPRAVLDAVVKRKIPSPRRESNPRTPDRPARSPALYRLSEGKRILGKQDESADWIHLAQDRNQCRAVAKRVIDLLVP